MWQATVPENKSCTTTSTFYPHKNQAIQQGWECPRCGNINAPWSSQCNCVRETWTITCGDSISGGLSLDDCSTAIDNLTQTYNTYSCPNSVCKDH